MDIRRNKIEFGDRIFARLSMGGKVLAEFMINRVCDMTELLGEIRHMTYGARGLAKLYVRNQSRGWSIERPLMLYSGEFPRRGCAAPTPVMTESQPQRTMLFPWETH